jgi:hypothetical protein
VTIPAEENLVSAGQWTFDQPLVRQATPSTMSVPPSVQARAVDGGLAVAAVAVIAAGHHSVAEVALTGRAVGLLGAAKGAPWEPKASAASPPPMTSADHCLAAAVVRVGVRSFPGIPGTGGRPLAFR